jgi:cytochrome bd-type quinol oxidase subunit 2
MSTNMSKPGRPLGVSLAIAASVLLYFVAPLLQVGMILLVESHFERMQPVIEFEGDEFEAITGGDFRGEITDDRLILQIVLGVAFLGLAAIAWRGKPSYIRFVFIGAVLFLTALTIGLSILPGAEASDADISGGSLDALAASLDCIQIGVSLLIPLYVIWYLNRGPARAFYRGYYLTEPARDME